MSLFLSSDQLSDLEANSYPISQEISAIMLTEGSLQCSQEPAIGLCPVSREPLS